MRIKTALEILQERAKKNPDLQSTYDKEKSKQLTGFFLRKHLSISIQKHKRNKKQWTHS